MLAGLVVVLAATIRRPGSPVPARAVLGRGVDHRPLSTTATKPTVATAAAARLAVDGSERAASHSPAGRPATAGIPATTPAQPSPSPRRSAGSRAPISAATTTTRSPNPKPRAALSAMTTGTAPIAAIPAEEPGHQYQTDRGGHGGRQPAEKSRRQQLRGHREQHQDGHHPPCRGRVIASGDHAGGHHRERKVEAKQGSEGNPEPDQQRGRHEAWSAGYGRCRRCRFSD